MMTVRRQVSLCLVLLLGALPLAAQQRVADRTAESPVDTRAAEAVLARVIDDLRIDRLSLSRAIDTIASLGRTTVSYRPDVMANYTAPVSFQAKRISLAAAFSHVLTGTSLRVIPLARGRIAIAEQGDGVAGRMAGGGVTGRVFDAKTDGALRGASVLLDDTVQRTQTDADGRYRFSNVAAGAHRITVRFVGFARQTRLVTVSDGQTAVVDFALSGSVNTLDQVVVTATGAQRYRELGHVVAQINADSLVREAPITNLSELLTARVPGLDVYTGNGGIVGGDVALRLRGQTTANLDPQPIVVVDGVRYKNTSRTVGVVSSGAGATRPYNAEPRSPLNDLNVNDIETVEVVKGPSASTLYGPDAANGVIVITTKRGKVGKPAWHLYAYPDLSVQPKSDATTMPGYRAWGHNPNTGALFNGNCTLLLQVSNCVLDSITVVQKIADDPRYAVLAKSRPQWHSGGNVGGGAPAFTYFFSGNYDSEVGALQISPFAANALKQQIGENTLNDAIKNPNSQQTLTLHTDITSQVNAFTTLGFTAMYTHATQRAINITSLWNNAWKQGVLPANVDTTSNSQLSRYLPINAFVQSTEDHVNHVIASANGTTHPWSWLTANARIGMDLNSTVDRGAVPAGVPTLSATGSAYDFRNQTTGRSATAGVTMMAHSGIVSFRTSLGAQYEYSNLDGLDVGGNGLAPGSASIGGIASPGLTQVWNETAQLGTFGEEVIGLNNRLFLTGSLRLDGATTLGDAYHARPFPKAGASWIVSDEPFLRRLHVPGLDELRLRYSYGASSRYPTSAMNNGNVGLTYTIINGRQTAAFDRDILANPLIRPERTRESEWGADLTVAANTRLGFTWYTRRTNDQINTLTVPYQFDTQWANMASLAARGFEATFDAQLLQATWATVNLNVSYAHNTNKVLGLGSATGYQAYTGSLAVGYPLDAAIGSSIVSFADTTGGGPNGIIERTDVTVNKTPHYLGVFFAPNVYTLSPSVLLLGGRVRVSSLFDRQRGGVQIDPIGPQCGSRGTCIAQYLKSTPLAEQAHLVGVAEADFLASSDFTRWRELSLTADLPQRFREAIWLARASVSLQVRNLMLWTRYQGPDPESVPGLGLQGLNSAYGGAIGIPQARSWALRFDISP